MHICVFSPLLVLIEKDVLTNWSVMEMLMWRWSQLELLSPVHVAAYFWLPIKPALVRTKGRLPLLANFIPSYVDLAINIPYTWSRRQVLLNSMESLHKHKIFHYNTSSFWSHLRVHWVHLILANFFFEKIVTRRGYDRNSSRLCIHCDSKNDSGNHQILHLPYECCSQASFLLQSEMRSDEIDCKVLPKV